MCEGTLGNSKVLMNLNESSFEDGKTTQVDWDRFKLQIISGIYNLLDEKFSSFNYKNFTTYPT